MKIGINVSWMTPGQAGGMEGYIRNLIDQLGVIDQENNYVLITAPNNYKTFSLPSSRWKMIVYGGPETAPPIYKVSPIPQPTSLSKQAYDYLKSYWLRPKAGLKYLRRQWLNWQAQAWTEPLSTLITQEGIELWFCPLIYALPLDTKVPIVITIPDLQHEHYPNFFSEAEMSLRAMGYQYSCKVATATIGISHFVADEIAHLYHIEPSRVFSTPLALDQSFQIDRSEFKHLAERVKLKYGLEQDFIFYPANGWAHKNHENLVKALALVHQHGYPVNLVLTGAEFDVLTRLKPLLKSAQLHSVVRHLGYVEKSDLIGLYSAAKMLVFPSHFEGFGLPLLEAMVLETPVACSKVDSLPEVGGSAVLYFDPDNPQSIAQAIGKLINDEDLRQQLVTAGKEQVKKFSYYHTAKQTLAVFDKIRKGALTPPRLPPFRPLALNQWLREGHSRWYFRSTSLSKLKIKVVQPAKLSDLIDQTVMVFLNDRKVLEETLEPQREYSFVIPIPERSDESFYQLDICASVKGQLFSLQVLNIALVDDQNHEIDLIK